MAKISISHPEETLQTVDKERLVNGVSHSEFLRQTVKEHLSRVKDREDVEQYIKCYLKYPETTRVCLLRRVLGRRMGRSG